MSEIIYGIFAVCYKDDEIYECQVIPIEKDTQGNLLLKGEVKKFKRQEIYDRIKIYHNKFITFNVEEGATVSLYKRGDKHFITTNDNETENDNLGSLPRYDCVSSILW